MEELLFFLLLLLPLSSVLNAEATNSTIIVDNEIIIVNCQENSVYDKFVVLGSSDNDDIEPIELPW